MTTSTRTAPRIRLACTYCHDGLVVGEGEFCVGCLAPHHADCFREHGQCSAPGCGARRVVGAPEPPRKAPIFRRRPALGPLCVVGALGFASLAVPAVLWRNHERHRRLLDLEARLAESRVANELLERRLAEALAKLEPRQSEGPSGIAIQLQGLRPDLPGGGR